MSNNVEIAKKAAKAFEQKDAAALKDLLAPDYAFKGPLMSANGRDEIIACMESCPFDARTENSVFVSEGGRVMHLFDWVVSAPFKGSFRMVESLVIEGGKVKSSELIYDTANFPKEALQQMTDKKQCAA